MAQMHPTRPQNTRSNAERKLFSLLERGLSDEFVVIHSVRWLQKDPKKRARDGEADFLILHPTLGCLVIEVKGGELRYQAEDGRWITRTRAGKEETLKKDPFTQVLDSKHSLIAYLREIPGWKRSWGPIGHAVCFPDAKFDSRPLPHQDPAIILDATDLVDPETAADRLTEVFSWWQDDRYNADTVGVTRIVDLLAHDLEIRRPLSLLIHEADEEIVQLSERQYGVLNFLSGQRRVAVAGPAGSGKTLIAVEKARRLAQEGLSVLYTCFNRPLADHVRASLQPFPAIRVAGFHELCMNLKQKAHLDLDPKKSDESFWDQLVEAVYDHLGNIETRYDAIIVDEGQDFEETWWYLIEGLLRDPKNSIFYVFFDDNQAIYLNEPSIPRDLTQVRLWENWRNTKPIFEAVMAFYAGSDVTCAGPDGPEVSIVEAEDDVTKPLSRLLHHLVVDEDVNPRDIVVLTPRALSRSAIQGRVGSFVLTEHPSSDRDILLSSIYRFKGLDARVVVVAEIERFVESEFKKLMYVACSRARALLAVIIQSGSSWEATQSPAPTS